jgi:hypothetical protein
MCWHTVNGSDTFLHAQMLRAGAQKGSSMYMPEGIARLANLEKVDKLNTGSMTSTAMKPVRRAHSKC